MASKNIKGITIEIGGNSTELQKALQKPERDARNLTSELKEINGALKFNPNSLELLSQKSTVLGQQVQAAAEKLQSLKEYQSQIEAQVKAGDLGEEQYRAYQREIIKTEDQLRSFQNRLIENDKYINSLSGNTKSAADSARVFEEALKEEKLASEKAKEEAKQHGKQLDSLKGDYNSAEKGALSFSDAVKASTLGNLFATGIRRAANALWDFAMAGAESARQLEVSERQLELVLRNTVNATDDYIDSIKELIDQEERLGVVSGHAQTAAAQELATYVTKKGTLEELIPVLNDMIAQQYGVNASQEAAVSVATQLGKTLDGQVGSLQRWGYRFSEAEQAILKTGTEAQKLRVIVNTVTDSVGGLSHGLRDTTEEGRMFTAMLDIQAKQREFGSNVEKIKNSLLVTLLPSLTEALDVINEYIVKNGDALANLGTILATIINALTMLFQIISAIPPPLLFLIAGLVLAVKTFNSMFAGLKAVNQILKPLGLGFSRTTAYVLALVAAVSVLVFLILALKEGSEKAAKAIDNLGNTANNAVNSAQPRGVNAYATGTHSAARGLAWVGENGPELVNFRGGEQVYTARQSAAMASPVANNATGPSYSDNSRLTVIVREDEVMQEITDWWRHQKRRARAMGVSD